MTVEVRQPYLFEQRVADPVCLDDARVERIRDTVYCGDEGVVGESSCKPSQDVFKPPVTVPRSQVVEHRPVLFRTAVAEAVRHETKPRCQERPCMAHHSVSSPTIGASSCSNSALSSSHRRTASWAASSVIFSTARPSC